MVYIIFKIFKSSLNQVFPLFGNKVWIIEKNLNTKINLQSKNTIVKNISNWVMYYWKKYFLSFIVWKICKKWNGNPLILVFKELHFFITDN